MSLANIRKLTQFISIRWRLTILFVTIFGTTLVLFTVLIFNFLASTLQREFDDALFNYAVDVNESISLDATGDLSFQPPALDKGKLYPFALGTALIQIRKNSGEILSRVGDFGSLHVPYKHEIDRLNKGEEAAFRTINKLEGLPNKEAEEYRMVTLPIDNSPIPQLVLQVAVPMTLLEDQIVNRKLILEVALPLAILIATLGSYLLSMRALRPVTEMIAIAKAIGAEKLSERLPVPAAKDEVQTLALVLNEMLSRIEKAFASQERFIADASHQLLSPLTIMRGEIEAAIRTGRSDATLLNSTLQEVEHLSQIVQHLLLLARVEADKAALQFAPIALDEVVTEAVSRAQRFAEKKSIRIQFNILNTQQSQLHPLVLGDFDLLQNLVFNLLENAIKYSPAESLIKVSLHWQPDQQVLSIEDEGPGIAEQDLPLIFARFHRGEHATAGSGYGLGLAIAKKIADSHSANLYAVNKKGCCFYFEIKNI